MWGTRPDDTWGKFLDRLDEIMEPSLLQSVILVQEEAGESAVEELCVRHLWRSRKKSPRKKVRNKKQREEEQKRKAQIGGSQPSGSLAVGPFSV